MRVILAVGKYTPATTSTVHADGVHTMLASLWGLIIIPSLLLYVHVQVRMRFTRVCLARITVTMPTNPDAHVLQKKETKFNVMSSAKR